MGPGLHPEIVIEIDDVDVMPDQPEELLEAFSGETSVNRSRMSWARSGSAASSARKLSLRYRNWPHSIRLQLNRPMYRPVGAFAQMSCTLDQQTVTVRSLDQMAPAASGCSTCTSAMASSSALVVGLVLGAQGK